ncbi:MAG: hypothetical protein A3H52_00855 [Candidatus Zambryskibacteria bacterium RIFCSPLOWO2_02_FULL_39_26]|uniref:Glutamyl-tRNA amidotransferase n=1 Tax=Candidatus Zambryskibacteria bacterium RIFCSPLOWO2_12_FULL_39_23 TaxID=1802776 RepID=A0A1G2UT89_9BACT|nr:MAG: hypothetical protein A2W51_00480 [Candidatus Zambryskibacteria bacterium RIFCSPHIGHO2_02_39_10]OHA99863.1 MAG: hypothetical protein A3E59_02385 [Candidatus Zambryskibacteria bacterium RIFCSPHIGHO2_12_FULL_39_47]OHB10268.1 MAG: hypothetical protein A3H52_00855 [Candidatus Zambryskibacteria bacterium RIFCSPLOWO2_02_FULL_39_26]OHB12607.1 MAG: hypothetical protein A3G99_02190 [Candidatus Zambryskibacteria bacterium RIFCSPLOWO2_12_FULL_39_23]
MKLHQQIREEIKEAMKAKDTIRLGVIRGLVAGFTNELVSLKRMPDGELSDDEALNVIRRGVNQRKDSIDQFTKGGRNDLADSEKAELAILETYLPAQMSKDEVLKIAEAKKNEMAITDKSKSGQLMSAIMKELKGKADGNLVKSVVDEILGS